MNVVVVVGSKQNQHWPNIWSVWGLPILSTDWKYFLLSKRIFPYYTNMNAIPSFSAILIFFVQFPSPPSPQIPSQQIQQKCASFHCWLHSFSSCCRLFLFLLLLLLLPSPLHWRPFSALIICHRPSVSHFIRF